MKTAVAFGVFDGLHKGHRAVLEKTHGYNSIAVTFKNLPKLGGLDKELLMTYKDREKALLSLGINKVEFLDLIKIGDMSPKEFLDYITSKYDLSLIACGENFRFGKGAAGDVSFLTDYCRKEGIELSVTAPIKTKETVISSSFIRGLIKEGKIERANEFLLFPFSFTSPVKKGDQRGRLLGFPTINQEIPETLVMPKSGVYKAAVEIEGKEYKAVSDIGTRPTFLTDHIAAETHILDYSGDLYGKDVKVTLQKYLREEIKFSSKDDLIKAIKKDISEVSK
ncbi:MAG: riboflavin biosynthesis protein RibF [Clostridia bacterium]|nr:riboflavin biosynthesis protein RibF [Clostridia bacterium]